MDSNQESNTCASSFDDASDSYDETESDVEIDERSDTVEDEEEREVEWNWSENFIENTTFPSKEVAEHTIINFTENMKPIDIPSKFFTEDIIDMLVAQAKIYEDQKSSAQGSASNWQKMNENNIRSFLGLLIIMGLHRVPQLRDYWRRHKICCTEVIANVMPRKEFYRIFLHYIYQIIRNEVNYQKAPRSSDYSKFLTSFAY